MLFSKLIHFLDNKSILGWIISQNSGYYPTKDKKVIGKFDRIFILEKIKKIIHHTWPGLMMDVCVIFQGSQRKIKSPISYGHKNHFPGGSLNALEFY